MSPFQHMQQPVTTPQSWPDELRTVRTIARPADGEPFGKGQLMRALAPDSTEPMIRAMPAPIPEPAPKKTRNRRFRAPEQRKNAVRRAAIMASLGKHQELTAYALQLEFKVSERTITRDISVLREAGAPIDGGPGFGYRLKDSDVRPLNGAHHKDQGCRKLT